MFHRTIFFRRGITVFRPSHLRALAYLLISACMSLTLWVYIQGAIMLYQWYQILQWCSEVVE
jgi:hypothetical protein